MKLVGIDHLRFPLHATIVSLTPSGHDHHNKLETKFSAFLQLVNLCWGITCFLHTLERKERRGWAASQHARYQSL